MPAPKPAINAAPLTGARCPSTDQNHFTSENETVNDHTGNCRSVTDAREALIAALQARYGKYCDEHEMVRAAMIGGLTNLDAECAEAARRFRDASDREYLAQMDADRARWDAARPVARANPECRACRGTGQVSGGPINHRDGPDGVPVDVPMDCECLAWEVVQ